MLIRNPFAAAILTSYTLSLLDAIPNETVVSALHDFHHKGEFLTIPLRRWARHLDPESMVLAPYDVGSFLDNLIMARVGEATSLNELIDGICTIDVQ